MRRVWCGSLVVGLVLGGIGSVQADDQAEMKALIARAIKAAGGKAKLAKLKEVTLKSKGTAQAGGQEIALTVDLSVQARERCRMELTVEANGMLQTVWLVINGDKSWLKANEKVEVTPKEILTMLQGDFHALRLAQRLALPDKDVKLSPLGEVQVGDQPAVGVKVEQKGRPDVSLYFDKKSGLPVKCELQVKEKGGQEVSHEFLFSAFKEMAGVKHFSKVVMNRDGKKLFEIELSEVKTEENLDKTLFEKP